MDPAPKDRQKSPNPGGRDAFNEIFGAKTKINLPKTVILPRFDHFQKKKGWCIALKVSWSRQALPGSGNFPAPKSPIPKVRCNNPNCKTPKHSTEITGKFKFWTQGYSLPTKPPAPSRASVSKSCGLATAAPPPPPEDGLRNLGETYGRGCHNPTNTMAREWSYFRGGRRGKGVALRVWPGYRAAAVETPTAPSPTPPPSSPHPSPPPPSPSHRFVWDPGIQTRGVGKKNEENILGAKYLA